MANGYCATADAEANVIDPSTDYTTDCSLPECIMSVRTEAIPFFLYSSSILSLFSHRLHEHQ